jgi:hypothetical protein
MEQFVDGLVDAIVAELAGPVTPVCGNGIREGSEECDGATCDTGLGVGGCFPPTSSLPCHCCAQGSLPCYVRGFSPVPVEIPCCTGVCNIPGPEAGPNVWVSCTETTTTTIGGSTSTTLVRTPCDGGSGYPTCDGACPAGELCGGDLDFGTPAQSCACFPIGITPCGAGAYPQCGGSCFADEVCQAFHIRDTVNPQNDVRICACVPPRPCTLAGSFCQSGTCPSELACTGTLTTTGTPCGCATPD